MQRVIALFFLILSAPFWPILYILVKLDSPGPFIFKQKRGGKNKKPFTMYKIRTMIDHADRLQKKYARQNEADGPVFKIQNDPRFTKIGKILAKTAIDEIPQFINIIKGEMALVGPRPLPYHEAQKVPKKYGARFSVLPGMTSPWIVKGAHKLTFEQWMRLDLQYVKDKSLLLDIKTLVLTIFTIINTLLITQLKSARTKPLRRIV